MRLDIRMPFFFIDSDSDIRYCDYDNSDFTDEPIILTGSDFIDKYKYE